MINKLTAEDDDQNKQFKTKFIKVKGEDRQEISMIETMVREIINIDIGQIVEIREYCSVVEYSMDRITETDQGIIQIIEVISEDGILEGICNQIRIIEVKIIEVDTEETIEMIIMKEVKVGPGIDSILIIPEGMIQTIVWPCIYITIGMMNNKLTVQELVPLEVELDATVMQGSAC